METAFAYVGDHAWLIAALWIAKASFGWVAYGVVRRRMRRATIVKK